jgi:hypothetical protein
MDLLVAVVEIDGATGVVIVAVFILVFLLVAGLAWFIVRNTTVHASRSQPAWRSSTNIPLPVLLRRATSERLMEAVAKGSSRPSLTSEEEQFVTGLARTRKAIAKGYRLGLVVAGMVGIGVSIAIYQDYHDDEMILLPVAIIFLLSLGVLISGVMPSRTVDPIEPIDAELLKNIHVDVTRQPLTIQLDEAFTAEARKMLERGMSPAEVAAKLTPAFQPLDDRERQALEQAIAMLRPAR